MTPTTPDTLARMARDDLTSIAAWLRDASSVVVLTGAGISTESGIPDFRGPSGVWTRNPAAEKTSDLRYYMSDPEIRRGVWRNRLESEVWRAEPNPGHLALVDLERHGALHALVTQNVDGLHQAAGTSPEIIVEIHGTALEVKCMSCGWRGPMHETLDRVRAGEEDPACLYCSGILKSATISFGEDLVAEDLRRAQAAASRCDVFLAVGTSLTVHPAAALPGIAARSGARLAVFNAEATPYDTTADAVVRDRLGHVLAALAELVRDPPACR